MTPRPVLMALGVTAVVQAVQPPVGFFADPIVAFVLRIVSVVLSLALSSTIIIACIKMIAYFGAAGEAQRNLTTAVSSAKVEFHDFRIEIKGMHEKFTEMLQAHSLLLVEHKGRLDDHERRFHDVRPNPGRRRPDPDDR